MIKRIPPKVGSQARRNLLEHPQSNIEMASPRKDVVRLYANQTI